MTVTGKDLINLGFPPGPALGAALDHLRDNPVDAADLSAWVKANKPKPPRQIPLQDAPEFHVNIEADDPADEANVAAVLATMRNLMRTPTIRSGAVMPDACPTGSDGQIPVGGVVVAENAIHPGMHSADICCSVMLTEFDDAKPRDILDAIHQVTHFGPGGRAEGRRYALSTDLAEAFRANPFLRDDRVLFAAEAHLGTQGDGNHFAFVGRSAATGRTCLVTHHGSRGVGAALYKAGMAAAERHRQAVSPETLKTNAWIPADTDEGRTYWDALQLVRAWTKANHTTLHKAAADVARAETRDRFWNEHNFVFKRGDLYYHAKGATPIAGDFLPDTSGTQIVPLNMAEPVLLIRGGATRENLGFAPHGAGRNLSRSAHKRGLGAHSEDAVFARETKGLDVRFWSGNIDVSELPSAYKPAATVRAQMDRFKLAKTVDQIEPYGSIMAGDWERDAPWKKKAAAKYASAARRET